MLTARLVAKTGGVATAQSIAVKDASQTAMPKQNVVNMLQSQAQDAPSTFAARKFLYIL